MREKREVLRRRLAGFIPLVAGFLALVVVFAAGFVWAGGMRLVSVYDDAGAAARVMLPATKAGGVEPASAMRLSGIVAGAHDATSLSENANGTAALSIRRAFTAGIVADGETHTAPFVEGSVADLLEIGNIALGPEDYVQPPPETSLTAGLTATVHRVSYAEETRREQLGEEQVAAYEASLSPEHPFVRDGLHIYDVLYRDRLIDGQIHSSEILSLKPTLTPRPSDSYDWIPGVPLSRIESFEDVEIGEDGLPTQYSRLWAGAVCTAYSASGGRGASGLGLYCGTVAVNPNVIPYGTRLFITSRDRSFIYGFAIATDTGTAMMEGYVGLDLFFEYNPECYRFGKRQLDVYILD